MGRPDAYSGNATTAGYEVHQTGATKTFTYDANGNLTSDGTRAFEWDARNQLTRVLVGGVPVSAFEYDGQGRRARIVRGQTQISHVHDGRDLVLERDTQDVTTYRINGLWLDSLVGALRSVNKTFYVSDHLGSVAATSEDGEPITSGTFAP